MDFSFLTSVKNKARLLSCMLLASALFYSKALISIAVVLIFLSSLIKKDHEGLWRLRNWHSYKSALSNWRHQFIPLSFIALFAVTLLNFPFSENLLAYWHFVKLKLPFLLIALAFIGHDALTQKEKDVIYLCYIITAVIVAVAVLINYVMDYELINQSIGRGHSIPTPIDNNKFSTLTALAVLISYQLLYENRFSAKFLRLGIFCFAIFLFVFLHVLAIRSGIVILYAGNFLALVYYLIKARRFGLLAIGIVGLSMLPIIAYETIPSVQRKVGYMLYDLERQQSGDGANYSDGERIRSLKIGWHIIQTHPILGTGIGDIRDECERLFAQWYPASQKQILPHNQFVFQAAAYGLIGLLLFMVFIYGPILLDGQARGNILYWQLLIATSLLFLVEKPLEEAVYISFFAFFSMIVSRR